MNESPRTPTPDFDAQLNVLAEDMSNGLGRQLAIDRLVELGLSEDEADDQEAAIREQLRAIHRGAQAIFRDLDHGLERQQAVQRFQELGMSRTDAVQAIESYRERKAAAQTEAKVILEEMNRGLGRAEAVTRFRDLGLEKPTAEHLVGMRYDATAHWYLEFIWLGVLSAAIGLLLLVGVLCSLPQPVTAYLIPVGMMGYGAFFAFHGWRRRRLYTDRRRTGPRGNSPFEVVRKGYGRMEAIAQAVKVGVPPEEAVALVSMNMDATVKIYRWFMVLGGVATAWGLYQTWECFTDWPQAAGRCLGAVALALWGLGGLLRGCIGWRRFSSL